MKKRDLYHLAVESDAVIVYRTDNNIGRIGVVFKNGTIRNEYSEEIPAYIYAECLTLLNTADVIFKHEGNIYSAIFVSKQSKQSKLYKKARRHRNFNRNYDCFGVSKKNKSKMNRLFADNNLVCETYQ